MLKEKEILNIKSQALRLEIKLFKFYQDNI